MWFMCSSNNKQVVHPLKVKKDVSQNFTTYVNQIINDDNDELNKNIMKCKSDITLSMSNMSINDNCSIATTMEPPNIILDELTPCELILYNEMFKSNISSFTIKYRRNTYYKENVIVALMPPFSELKYFNGKNVKMQLIVVDEVGSKYRFQDYINNHDCDFYEHHNFGILNANKDVICDKLKAVYEVSNLMVREK